MHPNPDHMLTHDAAEHTPAQARRESWPLRLMRLTLGYLWALVLALAGVWVWTHKNELAQLLPAGHQALVVAISALCLAGAQFVFMLLVADDLCPRTWAGLRMFLKTFTGSVIWMSLLWVVSIAWRWWY